MNRGYNSRRVYAVRLQSGAVGWRGRLQSNYNSFEEWRGYAATYALHRKLKGSIRKLWNENPLLEGSTDPHDFRRAI